MADRVLRIVEHSAAADAEDTFVVESALQERSVEEFETLFSTFMEADLGRVAGLPLYLVCRLRLARPFAQNRNPQMAITHLIVLFRLLDQRLAEGRYDAVDVRCLDGLYRAVVADVVVDREIEVVGALPNSSRRRAVGFLRGLVGFLEVVLDQLLSVVWKRTVRRVATASTLFVPHVNRFESTRPVLDRLGPDHLVVLPVATAFWLRHRAGRYASIREYDPVPLNYFASLMTAFESLTRAAGLTWSVLVRRSFEARLEAFIIERFGPAVPATIDYVLGNIYPVHLPALPNAVVAERMVATTAAERLVIGSVGSRQEVIADAASRAGLETFHVPHTATTGYDLLPPSETVHFVPAPHAVDYLEGSQVSEGSRLIPSGRPQLVALAETEVEPLDWGAPDSLLVVVATQPFADHIRKQFVESVLAGMESTPVPVDVVIKVHPNEDPSFYAETIRDRPYPIEVVEADLHRYLVGADLVITINSNVGLEAMVLGTPCVCVNEWGPLIRFRPYATEGPVPVLEAAAAIRDYFEGLTRSHLDELAADQHAFIEASYLDGDPAGEIAQTVDGRAADPAAEDSDREREASNRFSPS